MKKKVSVIVPVYNASKFLNKGIDSLINQTYKNIEIILLNDGSKDNSLDIMKDWGKKIPNKIKIYSHENMGVGKTRNRGIEVSTGEYITFMDADDYFEPNFIKELMSKIGDNDIIVSGYKKVDESGKDLFVQSLKEHGNWAKFKQVTVWAKIYKKSFILENQLQYSTLKIAEDILFSMTAYSKTSKIVSTSYVGYVNVENFASATHNDSLRIDNDMLVVLNLIDSEISKNKNFVLINQKELKYFYLKIFSFFLIDKSKIMSYSNLDIYYKKCMQWIEETFEKHNWKISFVWEKSEPLLVNFAINIVILMKKCKLSNFFNKLISKVFYAK